MGERSTRSGVLVGFGVVAAGHLEGYTRTTGLDIRAVVDCEPRRRRAALAALPDIEVYATLADALDSLDVSFVDVCTPPSSHLGLILEALSRDVPVICEKPLLLGSHEVPALLAALEASSAWVHPCHNYRFAPGVQALSAAMHAHGGEFVRGHFRTIRPRHAQGVPEWNADWRRHPQISGGGILRDHGPHSVYLAQLLICAKTTGVSCVAEGDAQGRWPGSEDDAFLILHSSSGAIEIELSWRGSVRETVYEVETTAGSFRLEGDVLHCVVGGLITSTIIDSGFDDPSHGSWFGEVFADFERVLDGMDPSPGLDDALSVLAVMDAAYKSASQGGNRVAVNCATEVTSAASGPFVG